MIRIIPDHLFLNIVGFSESRLGWFLGYSSPAIAHSPDRNLFIYNFYLKSGAIWRYQVYFIWACVSNETVQPRSFSPSFAKVHVLTNLVILVIGDALCRGSCLHEPLIHASFAMIRIIPDHLFLNIVGFSESRLGWFLGYSSPAIAHSPDRNLFIYNFYLKSGAIWRYQVYFIWACVSNETVQPRSFSNSFAKVLVLTNRIIFIIGDALCRGSCPHEPVIHASFAMIRIFTDHLFLNIVVFRKAVSGGSSVISVLLLPIVPIGIFLYTIFI